jgi:hypothetical protein
MAAASLDVFVSVCGRLVLAHVAKEFARDHLVSDARITSSCNSELLARLQREDLRAAVSGGRLVPRLVAIFAEHMRATALVGLLEVLRRDPRAREGALADMISHLTEKEIAPKLTFASAEDIALFGDAIARVALSYSDDLRASGMTPLAFARSILPSYDFD